MIAFPVSSNPAQFSVTLNHFPENAFKMLKSWRGWRIFPYAECTVGLYHRRRIKTEEKAKVVASVWGKEFLCVYIFWPHVEISFSTLRFTVLHNDPAAPQDHCGRCRIWTLEFCPRSLARYQWTTTSHMSHRIQQKRRPLPFLLSLSFFYARHYLVNYRKTALKWKRDWRTRSGPKPVIQFSYP